MGKKVRSARGEQIDFDLLKIKQQIASAPKPLDVQSRADFIDARLRRRMKRNVNVPTEVPVKPNDNTTMPGTEDVETTKIDNKKPTTRQRARPKSTSKKQKNISDE